MIRAILKDRRETFHRQSPTENRLYLSCGEGVTLFQIAALQAACAIKRTGRCFGKPTSRLNGTREKHKPWLLVFPTATLKYLRPRALRAAQDPRDKLPHLIVGAGRLRLRWRARIDTGLQQHARINPKKQAD
jgi:hypothetical protein